jgi:hypothetical protein
MMRSELLLLLALVGCGGESFTAEDAGPVCVPYAGERGTLCTPDTVVLSCSLEPARGACGCWNAYDPMPSVYCCPADAAIGCPR